MDKHGVAIVGANVAGLRAAEALRRSGYEERIVLLGDESYAPYDRPPLSKKFLADGNTEGDAMALADAHRLFLKKANFFTDQRIDLELRQRAVSLDCSTNQIKLASGARLAYDHLIIASGARARTLPNTDPTLDGVLTVRTLDDAMAIRAQTQRGKSALVIGAGVIGCEVAATLCEQGMQVTVIEASETPLVRAFGAAVGAHYQQELARRGIVFRLRSHVAELRGKGRVQEAQLHDGTVIPCDLVIVGIGVVPNTEWLQDSAVLLSPGGVLIDSHAGTNVANVYAAGDLTHFVDPRYADRKRLESIENAQQQAQNAAENILGKASHYQPTPFAWSDQFDLKLQSIGYVGEYDSVVFRGSLEENKFIAFHLRKGCIEFAIAVNRMKEVALTKKLIAQRTLASPLQLADLDVNLAELSSSVSAVA